MSVNNPPPPPPQQPNSSLFGDNEDELEDELFRQQLETIEQQRQQGVRPGANQVGINAVPTNSVPTNSGFYPPHHSLRLPPMTHQQLAAQFSNDALRSPPPPAQSSSTAAAAAGSNLNFAPSLPLPRPPPAPMPGLPSSALPSDIYLPSPIAPVPPLDPATSSDLSRIEPATLFPLVVEYFSEDYPFGVPNNLNEFLASLEPKQQAQWSITLTLARFFLTFKHQFINESDIRHYSRVVLDYPAFCLQVSKYLRELDRAMENCPDGIISCIACALHHVCITAKPPIKFSLPKLFVRLRGFRPITPLKHAIKAVCLGKFVCIMGTVVRTAPTRPVIHKLEFSCNRCHRKKSATFKDHLYAPPTSCDAPCHNKFFEPDRLTAECHDHQIIKVQEILHNANNSQPPSNNIIGPDGSIVDDMSTVNQQHQQLAPSEDQGRVPRTLEVLLIGADLVDSVIPGDVVSVCGFIKSRKQESGIRGRNASVFILYLDANSITKASQQQGENDAAAESMAEYTQRFKKEEPMTGDDASSVASGAITSSGIIKQPSPARALDPLAEFSPSELEAIHHLAEESEKKGIHLLKMLVASVCPTIFGHETIKAGLLLALLGGVNKHGPAASSSAADTGGAANSSREPPCGVNGSPPVSKMLEPHAASPMSVRGDIHILLVGDPGLGKSQMLRATSKASPRGVYISGGVTTKTGLTVTMVRDGKDGDFALEAGALVLADQGCCCIDEFDKMTSEHNALLEAMEQQSISIAKAGMVCSLAARTSVIAAANPVGGHYNRAKTVSENLKIGSPLLSRFDLVFIILDQPDMEKDQMLSEHIIKFHGRDKNRRTSFPITPPRGRANNISRSSFDFFSSSSSARPLTQQLVVRPGDADVMWCENERGEQEVDLLPIPLVRKYIAYAKRYCKPLSVMDDLSKGARDVLSQFYLSLRGRGTDSTPITTRQLEALIRLAEARAKADLREVVTEAHARDVVNLMKESMMDVEEGVLMDGDGSSTGGGRGRGGHSKSTIKKKFVTMLRRKAEVKPEPVFTAQELYTLHEEMNMKNSIDDFTAFIESLNTENFLLKIGPKKYKLMASSS